MKLLLFANTDWYLFNFRRSLASKLREAGQSTESAPALAPCARIAAILGDFG
jgi:hypothetical protein